MVGYAAFICVSALILVFYPASPPAGERIEHIAHLEVLQPILPDSPYRQEFVASEDGLSSVAASFGTYGGATRCTLISRVSTLEGKSLADERIPCGALRNFVVMEVARFEPQSSSSSMRYVLELSVAPGLEETVAPLGGHTLDLPDAHVAGKAIDQSLHLVTRYGKGGSALDQVPLALRRMAQYRPWWGSPLAVGAATGLLVFAGAGLFFARRRWLLLLLGFVFLLKGILWTVMLPPFEAPDEAAHFAYAEFMAEQDAIPKRASASGPYPPFSPQTRRAVRLLHVEDAPPGDRPVFGPGPEGPAEETLRAPVSPLSDGNGPAAGYSPAYYYPSSLLYEASAGKSVPDRVVTMRLWSVVLAVAAGLIAYAIGLLLFRGSVGPSVALGVAASFQPMFSQQTAALNNDALLIPAGFACLYMALRLIEDPLDIRLLGLSGVALGVAALAKPFAAALAPVLAAGWLMGRYRSGSFRRGWLRSGASVAAGFAAVFGPWFAAMTFWGFRPTSLSSDPVEGPRGLHAYLSLLGRDWFESLKLTWVDRFWGDFSWLDTSLPPLAYQVLRGATILMALAVIAWLGRLMLRRRRPDLPSMQVLLMSFAVISVVGILHLVEFARFQATGKADILQGRYALMILPAVLAIPILLMSRLRHVSVTVSAWTIALGVVFLQLLSVLVIVDRFYL